LKQGFVVVGGHGVKPEGETAVEVVRGFGPARGKFKYKILLNIFYL
jgi:hypothetical protein